MSLTVIENRAIDTLPVTYRQYAIAKFKMPIKEYRDFDLVTAIKNMLITAFAEMGLQDAGDEKVITFMRETLMNDFKKPKYTLVTLEEIKLFISNGIRGEYPTFNGQLNTINVQNIHYWIKCGLVSKERELALIEFNKNLAKTQTTEVPFQMKADISKKGCLRIFQEYKETGKLTFFPHKYYDMLNELIGTEYKNFKTLVADPVKRKEILNKVSSEYEARLLSTKKLYENKGRFKDAESIMLKITEGFKDDPILHNMQKKVLLTYYFNELIKNNKTLEL